MPLTLTTAAAALGAALVLMVPGTARADDDHRGYHWGRAHEHADVHDELSDRHDAAHAWNPYMTYWQHRTMHRQIRRQHRAYHGESRRDHAAYHGTFWTYWPYAEFSGRFDPR